MKTLAIQKINERLEFFRGRIEAFKERYDNGDVTDDILNEWYYNRRMNCRHKFIGYVDAFRDIECITDEEAEIFKDRYFEMENEIVYSC